MLRCRECAHTEDTHDGPAGECTEWVILFDQSVDRKLRGDYCPCAQFDALLHQGSRPQASARPVK